MSVRKGKNAKNQRRLVVARKLIKEADQNPLVADKHTLTQTIDNMRQDGFNFANYPEFRRFERGGKHA
jgi:hypothetical protein